MPVETNGNLRNRANALYKHPGSETVKTAVINPKIKNTAIKEELFRLTQAESGITEATDAQCENYAIRYSFAPIWKWKVPVNNEIVILPSHRLSIYIENDEASPAAWADAQKVRVSVWSADLRKMSIIFQGRYMDAKELQDIDKMAHFQIPEEKSFWLKSGDWIWVEGMCDNGTAAIYTIDVSDSLFSMEMNRLRHSVK